jgi:hypothetical protein
MLELILIFAVALLALPLVDIVAGPTPNAARVRSIKIFIIGVTLLILLFLLWYGPVDVLSSRHTWDNPLTRR